MQVNVQLQTREMQFSVLNLAGDDWMPFAFGTIRSTGVRGGTISWGTATRRKVAGSIPDGVTRIFSVT